MQQRDLSAGIIPGALLEEVAQESMSKNKIPPDAKLLVVDDVRGPVWRE